ncbi:MAG: arsenite methyltransferase [Coriobacteriia bacterium]|nr:arsenite methyltransferase [Coriobacteriia bacterium]
MTTHDEDAIKEAVRGRYASHARAKTSCCDTPCACNTDETPAIADYDAQDLAALPAEANLGLGCGNPLAFDSILPGETVVDLGSGGGIDCFLAARRVGPEGLVIGVDMTAEMVLLAQRNAERDGYTNVDFRLGEIEDLPIDTSSADLVISNCVINLVPDKTRAFAEAFRVLKPGGRISVSDIVTSAPIPEIARGSVSAYVACLGGALVLEDYIAAIGAAGFENVSVVADSSLCTSTEEAEELLAAIDLDSLGGLSREEALRAATLFHSITVNARRPV